MTETDLRRVGELENEWGMGKTGASQHHSRVSCTDFCSIVRLTGLTALSNFYDNLSTRLPQLVLGIRSALPCALEVLKLPQTFVIQRLR